jgi:type I restriction enzyme, R subunit
MTTKLEGLDTIFLPFNKGNHGAKGNEPNPDGHHTSYLWEELWQRDSWVEILGRYLVTRRDDKKEIVSTTFPRYHQLDATRKLQAQILKEGAGSKFLIQQSAGSGKTNSIAWSARFLADLHDANNAKLFHTVIVISDRNVIDSQLQEPCSTSSAPGVVETIKSESGNRAASLLRP